MTCKVSEIAQLMESWGWRPNVVLMALELFRPSIIRGVRHGAKAETVGEVIRKVVVDMAWGPWEESDKS